MPYHPLPPGAWFGGACYGRGPALQEPSFRATGGPLTAAAGLFQIRESVYVGQLRAGRSGCGLRGRPRKSTTPLHRSSSAISDKPDGVGTAATRPRSPRSASLQPVCRPTQPDSPPGHRHPMMCRSHPHPPPHRRSSRRSKTPVGILFPPPLKYQASSGRSLEVHDDATEIDIWRIGPRPCQVRSPRYRRELLEEFGISRRELHEERRLVAITSDERHGGLAFSKPGHYGVEVEVGIDPFPFGSVPPRSLALVPRDHAKPAL